MTTNKKQRLRYGVKLKEKIWGTFRHNELPFSEVFRECDKDAWRHRNTLLPLCRSLTSWWLEHILFRKIEQTEQLEFLRLPNHERNKIEWWKPCPSSLNTSSRFSDSFSFFPLRRFFPPFPDEKWNEERFIPNNQQQIIHFASNLCSSALWTWFKVFFPFTSPTFSSQQQNGVNWPESAILRYSGDLWWKCILVVQSFP